MAGSPSEPRTFELNDGYGRLPTRGLGNDPHVIESDGIDDHDVDESLCEDMGTPRTPPATAIVVDETPVSKKLAENDKKPQLSLPGGSGLIQRPSSSGDIFANDAFSFMPANLGRHHRPKQARNEKFTGNEAGKVADQNMSRPQGSARDWSGLRQAAPPPPLEMRDSVNFMTHDGKNERRACDLGNARLLPSAEVKEWSAAAEDYPQGAERRVLMRDGTRPKDSDNLGAKSVPAFEMEREAVGNCEDTTSIAAGAEVVEVTAVTPPKRPKSRAMVLRGEDRPRTTTGLPLHDSRISKTPRSRQMRPNQRQRPPQNVIPATPQGPSEEDLLFLLMSRARETSKAMKKLQDLESQNISLRQEKAASDAELEQAVTEQAKSAQQQEKMINTLRTFKEKYYKLKQWAFEANQDCESLQQQASGFRKSLSNLAKEREDIDLQLGHIKSSYNSARGHLEKARCEIRDLKTETQTTISTMSKMDGILLSQGNHLQSERQRCRKLEAHIAHLERERNKQDTRLNGQHDLFIENLKKISASLGALENDKTKGDVRGSRILECLSQCQSLLEDDTAKRSDLEALQREFVSTTNGLNSLEKSIAETVQKPLEALRLEMPRQMSTEGAKLLSAFQSDNKDLIAATAEIASLKTTNTLTKDSFHLLNLQQQLSEDRERTFQQTIETLVGTNEQTALKHVSVLENSVSSLTIRWQSVSSQLLTCKREKKECQDEITDLRVCLGEALGDVECCQADLTVAKDLLTALEAEREHEENEEVFYMERRIRDLQDDLDYEIQMHNEREEELVHLQESRSRKQQDLDKLQEKSEQAAGERQELQDQVASLEKKLAEAVACLEDVTTDYENMRQSQASFDQLKNENLSQQQDIAGKTLEMQALHEEIGELQRQAARLEQQGLENTKTDEKNTKLEKEVNDLRQELVQMTELQKELQQTSTKVAELVSALAVAQKEAARANKFQQNNVSLQEKVVSLTFDLRSTQERCEDIEHLQERNKEKDVQIKELTGRVAVISTLSQEIESLKGKLQQAEEKNASQQQMIMTLEGAISNASLDRESNYAPHPRRAADRSGNGAGTVDGLPHQHQDPVHIEVDRSQDQGPTSSKLLCDPTIIIRETQFDTQNRPINEQSDSELSELSELSSICELTEPEDNDEQPLNEHRQKASKGSSRRNVPVQDRRARAESSQPVVERPVSSPYGSQSDQMLLDQISQSEAQLHTANLTTTSRHILEQDVEGEETVHALPWNRMASPQRASPRRLRSESQARFLQAPPVPSGNFGPRLERESTPVLVRERHRPNSAVKRRVELEDDRDMSQGNSKRLKRTPANLEVRSTRGSTPKPSEEQPAASRPASIPRKGSSIVGTNAPAPGKAQRAPKPTRKGSRQDKYSRRFSSQV